MRESELELAKPSLFGGEERVDKRGVYVPAAPESDPALAPFARRTRAGLPSLTELETVRHFTRLSRLNFSVDANFYPLGSCTMKYNPRVAEAAAVLPGFAGLHPCAAEADAQGALELTHRLGEMLLAVTGMDAWTPQPAAGAHGEYVGMGLVRAWFASRGEKRHVVLVPDSAHGTNPASAAMHSFTIRTVASGPDGLVDLADLERKLDGDVAALMLTNPNTLGLFETGIQEIQRRVHAAGGLLYYDGANLNAIAGIVRPGDMGFDVVHLNLHKTFGTPHGGGGPGAGPVLCKARLAPFLPAPGVVREGEPGAARYRFDWRGGQRSLGRVRAFHGQFPVLVRAYTYLVALGGEGLRRAAERAVLNANYLRARLSDVFDMPQRAVCMHEFVLSAKTLLREKNVRALDIAKGLIDRGIHPPTVYFPLIVPEAIMIEPTETESRETLDEFVAAMHDLARLAESDPAAFAALPLTTPVSRVDEVRAVKEPRLRD